jgi:hypothetical protein
MPFPFILHVLPLLFSVPQNKMTLKGRRFQMVVDIIMNMMDEVTMIQQTSIKQCFQIWCRLLLKDIILKRINATNP